jgi:hypothetical protein
MRRARRRRVPRQCLHHVSSHLFSHRLPPPHSHRPSYELLANAGAHRHGHGRGKGAAPPAPPSCSSFVAAARERTQLLAISRELVSKLPPPTFDALVAAAKQRHAHRLRVLQRASARATRPLSASSGSASAPALPSLHSSPHMGQHTSAVPAPHTSNGAASDQGARRAMPASSTSRAAAVDEIGGRAARAQGMQSPGLDRTHPNPNPNLHPKAQAMPPPGLDRLRPGFDRLRPPPGFDRLLTPARLLVYGPHVACEPKAAARLAARAIAHSRSLPHRVEQRRAIVAKARGGGGGAAHGAAPAAERVAPPEMFRHLDSAVRRSIVDGIRRTPPEHQLQQLRRETRDAALAASKGAFVPPSNSKSMFVQLRRAEIEREASGNPYHARGEFLLPSATPPPHTVAISRPPSTAGGAANAWCLL